MDALNSWLKKNLNALLSSDIDETYFEYFMTLTSEEDITEFCKNLLGDRWNKSTLAFVNNFIDKKIMLISSESLPVQSNSETSYFPKSSSIPLTSASSFTDLVLPTEDRFNTPQFFNEQSAEIISSKGLTLMAYVKPSQEPDYMSGRNVLQQKPQKSQLAAQSQLTNSYILLPEVQNSNTNINVGSKKLGKPSYVPLTSQEGSNLTTKLPGRYSCQCIAQKHALVNNCLDCGRIVCTQEGTGPCLFCGTFVVANKELELFNRNYNKSNSRLYQYSKAYNLAKIDGVLREQKLHEHTTLMANTAELDQAIAYKDRLLEYNKTCEARTKVYDDESDYFTATWMGPEQTKRSLDLEKEQYSLRHASKKGAYKVTLDFAGRQVYEDKKLQLTEEELNNYIEGGSKNNSTNQYKTDLSYNHSDYHETLVHPNVNYSPKYVETALYDQKEHFISTSGVLNEVFIQTRIQDSHLAELADTRSCLSIHQPWASLLVHGIKKDEGRTWPTNHRGRLWIASTAQPASQKAIQDAETYYKSVYGSIIFPNKYPSGFLLGCVNVTDCCPREDGLPKGYNDSPFSFICEDPQVVAVQYPIKGQHKIWKLDLHIHNAAKRLLKTTL